MENLNWSLIASFADTFQIDQSKLCTIQQHHSIMQRKWYLIRKWISFFSFLEFCYNWCENRRNACLRKILSRRNTLSHRTWDTFRYHIKSADIVSHYICRIQISTTDYWLSVKYIVHIIACIPAINYF